MLYLLLLTPFIGALTVLTGAASLTRADVSAFAAKLTTKIKNVMKSTSLNTVLLALAVAYTIYTLHDNSSVEFQFVQEGDPHLPFGVHLGLDGICLYFIVLTGIIGPICVLTGWTSILRPKEFLILILGLEILLYVVFIALDALLFYIFFESILPPLFLLIGLFGSSDKVRASFYIFLYTLLGSLFLLTAILLIQGIVGNTDYDNLFKGNLDIIYQIVGFVGIFIAFAVKTPTIFLNSWLLKAHVESPLGGSILLAGVKIR